MPSSVREDNRWFDQFKEAHRASFEGMLNQYKFPDRYDYNKIASLERICDVLVQNAAELYSVDEFISSVVRAGHQIPINHTVRLGGARYSFELFKDMVASYFKETNPIYLSHAPVFIEYALAQHHGIPTRALDWTYHPFIAAFFATYQAIQENEAEVTDVAVWAINLSEISNFDSEIQTEATSLKWMSHPISATSYLFAQKGLLILDDNSDAHYLENGWWRSFEQAIASDFEGTNKEVLRKVTLPVIKAKDALRLLSAEGVSLSNLMPSLDSIVKDLQIERAILK
jgi:hypothetical protein